LGNVWRDLEVWPNSRTFDGLLIVEFRGPLSFASADYFQEQVEQLRLTSKTPVDIMVLNFASVHDLDSTSIEMLRELLTEWRKRNVSCIIAEAKSRVRLMLEENFGKPAGKGKIPLLDQASWVISLDEAVQVAKQTLARKGRSVSAYNTKEECGRALAGGPAAVPLLGQKAEA